MRSLVASLVLVGLLAAPASAAWTRQPVITQVMIDTSTGAVSIHGKHFTENARVFLGLPNGQFEELAVVSATETMIMATTATTTPGTCLLVVRTGRRWWRAATMDVTITADGLICDNCIPSTAVQFNYAGSLSKGGPASDVACVGCVSSGELDTSYATTGDLTSHAGDATAHHVPTTVTATAPLVAAANQVSLPNVSIDTSAFPGGRALTAVGFEALKATLENVLPDAGLNSTAVGFRALANNATGAAPISDDGRNNTAMGYNALSSNTKGFNNTGVGFAALFGNTTGHTNVGIGQSALALNTTGTSNVAIGRLAGFDQTTGNGNIYLGDDVRGVAGESHAMYLGKVGTVTKAVIGGVHGVTTGAGAITVLIDSAGQLGTVSSSRRVKRNIEDMNDASQVLLALRPVTFQYTAHPVGGPTQYGLIAEEVAEVAPNLVVFDEDGQPETVQYRKVNAMLLNEVQRQHRQLQRQQSQIEQLLASIKALGTC